MADPFSYSQLSTTIANTAMVSKIGSYSCNYKNQLIVFNPHLSTQCRELIMYKALERAREDGSLYVNMEHFIIFMS